MHSLSNNRKREERVNKYEWTKCMYGVRAQRERERESVEICIGPCNK